MAKKEIKKDVVVPVEDGVVEVMEVAEVSGRFGVRLSRDIPYGPKVGTRYFDNKADAEAYQKRFGGEFV
jgi:hypothetical protein